MSLAFLLLLQLFSQNGDIGFADDLMRQSDYFRAITEYKRVLFYSTNDSVRNYCCGQISEAYRRSEKYESAIEYASELLSHSNDGSRDRYRANLLLGRAYSGSNMPQLSYQYFQSALEFPDTLHLAQLYLGATYFEFKNIEKSLEYFSQVEAVERDSARRAAVAEIIAEVNQYEGQSPRSPFLASALSALLPGAGQAYSAHYYDALQAFLYTSAAAAGTYAMYKYEHSGGRRPLWTYVGLALTSTFYVSNIIGANQTADYYNWKIHSDVARRIYARLAFIEQ